MGDAYFKTPEWGGGGAFQDRFVLFYEYAAGSKAFPGQETDLPYTSLEVNVVKGPWDQSCIEIPQSVVGQIPSCQSTSQQSVSSSIDIGGLTESVKPSVQ